MKKLQVRFAAFFLLAVLFIGIFPTRADAAQSSKPYLIKVNKKMCTVTVYKKDSKGQYTVPVKAMLCSTGADTPVGTFRTPARYRWQLLMGDVWGQYCTRITGGVLFHSVWYYEKDPSTLSNRQYNNLGKMVSHGCVRLNVEDVKWIYDNCPLGTTVVIYNSDNPGPLGKPKGIKVSEATKMGYDPTDIWSPNNPYIKKKLKPTISGAKNRTINYGEKNVKVTDKVTAKSATGVNLSSSIKASISFNGKKVTKVDTKTAGNYNVTYKVTDSNGQSAQKSVVFTVVDNVKPVLKASGNLYWNKDKKDTRSAIMKGVTAKWHDESYDTKKVTYKTTVEKTEKGLKVYKVTYTLKTPNGKSANATRKIYVDTQAPVLEGVKDMEVLLETGGELSSLDTSLFTDDLFVYDNFSDLGIDDIKVELEPVDAEYCQVVYTVKDQAGNVTTAKAKVHIEREQEPSADNTGDAGNEGNNDNNSNSNAAASDENQGQDNQQNNKQDNQQDNQSQGNENQNIGNAS